MKIKDLTHFLENIAPRSYQENYDNSGLLVGDPEQKIKGVLICLDSTEEVVEEAIQKKSNLIIAHHPIIFKGLKKLTGSTYVERTVAKAIRNNISIYAIHTNLDNVIHDGVNTKITEVLGLENVSLLSPKQGFKKLSAFVSPNYSNQLKQVLYNAGAGSVNQFDNDYHLTVGVGGDNGNAEARVKMELIFDSGNESKILRALNNANGDSSLTYNITSVEKEHPTVGSGMIGYLKEPIHEKPFLQFVKRVMKAQCVKYTRLSGRKVHKVAVCGGSGGFLLPVAISKGADVFITSDYKYHEFFDADGKIVIADIGHYESEQYTIELLYEIITNNFSTFAIRCTEVNTNPVKYL